MFPTQVELATLKFASLGSAAKSGSLHDVLHCYACIPLMLVYLSTILYELLIMNLSVHKRSANGKTPISLSVLCKVRYQQPADNVYRVLQHAFIIIFQHFPIPYSIPFRIPAFTVSR